MGDAQSSVTSGFHLFLEPGGALREQLAAQITQLAMHHGGPVFPPHVTLLGSIDSHAEEEVLQRAAALARTTAPLPLTLGALAGEPTFFRAFYITVPLTDELRTLHTRAKEVFGSGGGEYRPHLSLFYGLIDEEVRARMARETAYPLGGGLVAEGISVYHGEGPADTWEKLAFMPFAGG